MIARNHLQRTVSITLCLALVAAIPSDASESADPLDACNVAWDSPSQNAHGSMPLGNGEVGINAWVEPSGDLVFYISKTDAWDENARVCKIGRVRVKFDPPLPTTTGFRQELKLREGRIAIAANNGVRLNLWVDANQPLVHLETESATPLNCRAAVELWRLRERPFGNDDDSHTGRGLSASDFKPTVLPDVVVDSGKPRVVWYHRNTRSIFELGLKVQHLETLKGRFADPLLNHTFGASLHGDGFVADGPKAIKSAAPAKRHALSIAVLTAQTDTPEAWLAQLDQLETTSGKLDPAIARGAHETWWSKFWNRSWVFVGGANSLTNGYVLQRFMNACSGRGGSPIKFNGSIFTVEAQPGAAWSPPAPPRSMPAIAFPSCGGPTSTGFPTRTTATTSLPRCSSCCSNPTAGNCMFCRPGRKTGTCRSNSMRPMKPPWKGNCATAKWCRSRSHRSRAPRMLSICWKNDIHTQI
ncbi:MAG: DUF5703 domain-containing protein [Verrucomicrobia bacterium]|nr:DUF5703 domain-containing protein [Verrucomicrobiota bacterium]